MYLFEVKKSLSLKIRGGKTRKEEKGESKLGHHAYQHLKKMLLSGELAAGDKISEVQLAADLGMSRTPVREAIRRLEVEGVLEPVASSGTFVKHAERSTIIEVYELRIAIESFAVQKAARRMKPAQMKHGQDLCDQMLAAIRDFRDSGKPYMTGDPLRRYLNADISFHLLLLNAAENRHALAIYNDLNLRTAIFGFRSHDRDLRHVARVWCQHARVARALRKRDSKSALRSLETHMFASMEAALDAYDAHMAGRGAMDEEQADLTEAMAGLMAGANRSAT
ncbi:MAG: GntR family transcriptional regulator [Verrucomicrobiaceae bacterium]|nr:MAG: GntR family transcriptional regulator [Verrucomicrobiaceae bacterium]